MKFTVQREVLLAPLQAVASIVDRKNVIPILSNILIDATETEITLTGTDKEIEMVVHISVVPRELGRCTVPAKKFLDLCKAIPDATEITVLLKDGKCLIRAGSSQYVLSTLPPEEFPNIDKITKGEKVSFSQEGLKKIIQKTQFCVSLADMRYTMMGALFEIRKNSLVVCGTDGHRLALCKIDIDSNIEKKVIIPRKGLNEMFRLLHDGKGDVEVIFGKNHVRMTLPDITLTSKLIDGEFPQYQRLFEKNNDKTAFVPREELRLALQRASIFSDERNRGIRFKFSTDHLILSAINQEREQAEEDLVVEYKGAPVEISFNVNYVLSVLSVIEEKNIVIDFSTPENTAFFKGDTIPCCRYIISPIRM